jgi:hypothetical protein
MNSGAMLVQTMAQFKDMGADKELMEAFLSKLMLMDEDVAKLFAKIVDMKPPEPAGGEGFGGGGGGGEPFAVPGGTGAAEDDQKLDAVFDAAGRMSSIPLPSRTVQWMGFDGPMSLKADLDALAERHPEYYEGSADKVLEDIQFVLAKPDNWFIHNGPKVSIFRERIGSGVIPLVRVELDVVAGQLVARSVYASGKNQIAKKMKDRAQVLKGLGRSGQSYDSLTIAEYLSMLGSGSSRPVSTSVEHPKV